ncbi:MAG: hypothetical protein JNM68_04770 [Dinghuibacter sp.]|nr:hypothetical protein [Dinghuibacter sp.]
MKKIISLLLAATLLFTACKKNENPVETGGANAVLRQKVIQWMNKQQTETQPHRVALNKAIQEHLQWEKAWAQPRDKNEQLLMIPISNVLKLRNNSKLETYNYLLLFIDVQGNIFAGHVFQSIGNSQFTKNTIPAYYNISGHYPGEVLNGTYCIMNIHDIFYYEKVFENNQLKQTRTHLIKPKEGARTADNCVDWYTVTTYYNTETGETLYQVETYLGTSCSGCVPYTGTPQTSLTGETEWDCNVGGGSGEDSEEDKIGYKNWKVMDEPGYPDSYGVRADEYFKGKYVTGEPQGGHFKKIIKGSTGCSFCGTVNPYDVWIEEEHKVGLISPQEAFSKVKGHLNFKYVRYDADKTVPFTFAQVFP